MLLLGLFMFKMMYIIGVYRHAQSVKAQLRPKAHNQKVGHCKLVVHPYQIA